jgi:HK97 family phage portal protein
VADEGIQLEKSQVSVPVPGMPSRFTLLGGAGASGAVYRTRKENYGVYYEMYKQHPIVRASVEKISKYAVSNGYHFEKDDPLEEGEIPDYKRKTLNRFFKRSKAQHLLRLSYKDMLIYGEAFWHIERSVAQTPFRALRLHPKFMIPILDENEEELIGWEYGTGPSPKTKKYAVKDVIHFKLDDPESDLTGLSLLASLELTVAADLNAMHFNGNFFENGAQTGLIIAVRTATGEEAKRNREWLEQNYVGTRNAHRPMLIEGDVTVTQGVGKLNDMQYVEGRMVNRQEIMSVMDIPPDRLQVLEDFRRQQPGSSSVFQMETISPLQTLFEEEINLSLLTDVFGWDDVVFKHNAADDRTELELAKLYAEYERIGVMSINQIAGRLGLPKVEGGDTHFVQTAAGMIPVDILDEVAKRLIIDNSLSEGKLPDPISGLGTDTFGGKNPPKNTGAEESKLDD